MFCNLSRPPLHAKKAKTPKQSKGGTCRSGRDRSAANLNINHRLARNWRARLRQEEGGNPQPKSTSPLSSWVLVGRTAYPSSFNTHALPSAISLRPTRFISSRALKRSHVVRTKSLPEQAERRPSSCLSALPISWSVYVAAH